ncbi:hypothetical protein HMPREF0813_01847 [Streptococcus anginosus F0211]|uniref:Uncharacterized protein n=1 Tax=Streptococcus anginosus F0211 TaxID=706437 RepID=E6J3J4_STRAP|nr:hypothetical protein HMPREF0813_01847 [Streptococcus anginosus F0211]ETS96179.1 hypothetical protein HMPREF1512_1241 [Streptococcus sp. OBRC6]
MKSANITAKLNLEREKESDQTTSVQLLANPTRLMRTCDNG